MQDIIKVIIIEDDPMVSYIHKNYTEEVSGFEVIEEINVNSQSFSREDFDLASADLILLDIYLPGQNGLDLLRQIREDNRNEIDVIIVSAAKNSEVIDEALKLGAVDYIIKPFSRSRLKKSLQKYRNMKYKLTEDSDLNQSDVDGLINRDIGADDFEKTDEENKKTPPRDQKKEDDKNRFIRKLPKGLSSRTLERIENFLKESEDRVTARQIAEASELARVTVQRYLKFLEEEKRVEVSREYGSVGRPTHYYNLKTRN